MILPKGITGSWKTSDSGDKLTFTKEGEFYVNDKLEAVHQAAFDKAVDSYSEIDRLFPEKHSG